MKQFDQDLSRSIYHLNIGYPDFVIKGHLHKILFPSLTS